uniref:Carm_PH domain-containing protein n=1 Tax=Heterorhabditis bacteriophora TaxID=37862 RepID=A0A1I7XP60_HETBA
MAGDVTPRACHSFRRTYAALCDFYDQPYREEDVEKIYTINKIKMLRVEDFSHLLPKDFITLFASALQNNNLLPIESIDLSRNVLDDKKGFTVLSSILPRITSLRSVNMSECGLADKCMQLFCAGIYSGLTASKTNGSSLTYLNLASNPIKEDVSSLVNLVSLCTSLRVLDLSDTAFPLDKLWPALKYGGLQIERLMLGGCLCGKKPSESAQVKHQLSVVTVTGLSFFILKIHIVSVKFQSVKEFFSMAVNLTHISFANTSLPPELMKAMLLGLASNQQLKPFELDLDGTCEKGSAAVLEACLGGVRFSSISLRDNNLEAEMQGVVHALCSVSTLRKVNLGGANLAVLRRSSKQVHGNIINKILLDIVKLYADDSALEELILSDARLGAHLSVLLNTLGAASTLRVLDISSNEMSNFGARILSKALQLNVSLRTVIIDNNHIGADGFSDLATAVSICWIKAIWMSLNKLRMNCQQQKTKYFLRELRSIYMNIFAVNFELSYSFISDWRWQELCERSELALRSVANCVSCTPLDESPNHPSPRMVKRLFFNLYYFSCFIPFKIVNLYSLFQSLSNRLVFRPAMLPDAALLSSVQLRPALDRASSPKSDPFPSNLGSPTINRIDRETESPPPLPHRNRSGNPIPPMLPPKPAPRNALPTMAPVLDESDENANSRRSVADMARIFNR